MHSTRKHRLALSLCAGVLLSCAGGTGPAGIQEPDPPGPGPSPGAEAMASLSSETLDLGPDDVAGSVRLINAGGAALQWSVTGPDWFAVAPAGGSLAPGATVDVTVVPDRAGLAPGSHRGMLVLDSNGGNRTIVVDVAVAAPARLTVSPGAIDFGADGSDAGIALVNEGGVPLAWSATANVSWLSVSPATGTSAPGAGAIVAVEAERDGLSPGEHHAQIRIASNGGEAVLPVLLRVADPGVSVALAGRVVDQFSGAGLAGLTVRYGAGSAVTAADGRFTVAGLPPAGPAGLTIEGGGIHRRQTFARPGEGEWRVLPASFDLDAFDDMGREYAPRTIRWTSPPHIYFDVRPPVGYAGPEVDGWIAETREVLASFVAEWTRGRVLLGSITIGTAPPAEGTPGTIVIRLSETPEDYPAHNTVGLARTFWGSDMSIYASRILLRFSLVRGSSLGWARRGVVGHELGHALGVGHMEVGKPSLMTPSISTSALSPFDREVGEVLYSRAAGSARPDTEELLFWRGALAPSARPLGSHEWVCGLGAALRP